MIIQFFFLYCALLVKRKKKDNKQKIKNKNKNKNMSVQKIYLPNEKMFMKITRCNDDFVPEAIDYLKTIDNETLECGVFSICDSYFLEKLIMHSQDDILEELLIKRRVRFRDEFFSYFKTHDRMYPMDHVARIQFTSSTDKQLEIYLRNLRICYILICVGITDIKETYWKQLKEDKYAMDFVKHHEECTVWHVYQNRHTVCSVPMREELYAKWHGMSVILVPVRRRRIVCSPIPEKKIEPHITCPICLENCKTVMAIPCGHIVCQSCEPILKKKCHSCRNPYDSSIRLFF